MSVSTSIEGRCHCGDVRFVLSAAPKWLTLCNCSVCRRLGALWGHIDRADVRIESTSATREYVTGERLIAFHSCATCGCTTHWTDLDPDTHTRMAVNFRMCAPGIVARLEVRKWDGAVSGQFLPDAPTVPHTGTVLLSHVHLGMSNLKASMAFYEAVLAPLGVVLKFVEDERGWAGWKRPDDDRPLFLVGRPLDGTRHAAGSGQMVAFLASSRAAVDRCHAIALAGGGTDEGAPGLRPEYHDAYYGAYFRDPDGNKVCVCCHEAEPPVAEAVD